MGWGESGVRAGIRVRVRLHQEPEEMLPPLQAPRRHIKTPQTVTDPGLAFQAAGERLQLSPCGAAQQNQGGSYTGGSGVRHGEAVHTQKLAKVYPSLGVAFWGLGGSRTRATLLGRGASMESWVCAWQWHRGSSGWAG